MIRSESNKNLPSDTIRGEGNTLKISESGESDTEVCVTSECPAIFRVVDHDQMKTLHPVSSAVFHVPSFPSVDTIDPAAKLYEKRDELDADLVELLLCIDWKINLLIKTLSPIRDEAVYPYRAVITTISMKEMTLQTTERLSVGTPLEFHFVLPVLPFREIFLRGKVDAASETPNEYTVAIMMADQSEASREHLIRYIVKRQFQLKREQTLKKQGGLRGSSRNDEP